VVVLVVVVFTHLVDTNMRRISTPIDTNIPVQVFDPDVSPWTEDIYYEFNIHQEEELKTASNELHRLFMDAVKHVIDMRLFPLLGIGKFTAKLITDSFANNDPSIVSRFDFIYDGIRPPKLLDYNTDSVELLMESAITQKHWREKRFPGTFQFNTIDNALVQRWKSLAVGRYDINNLVFYTTTPTPMPREERLAQYIMDTARRAGFNADFIPIQDIGWDGTSFIDMDNHPIKQIYKIYPWDRIIDNEFGENIPKAKTLWLEPAWKMLLGHKGLLPILWEMNPFHPNLLPTMNDSSSFHGTYLSKPVLGYEGANITIRSENTIVENTDGDFGDSSLIYQLYAPPAAFDDYYPNVSTWMVGDVCSGMVVRESKKLILGGDARVVPHIVVE
jgi:glutathionylspermidine synthase